MNQEEPAAMTQATTRERGMILVIVLWSVSMMAVIVVALSAYAQRNLVAASIEMDRLRTEMVLRSGVEGRGRFAAWHAGPRPGIS